ncbi:MAG: hypothetical protein OK404_01165 [Thaumarchaeota archaeon]|nr:hypothetical protein [Nitrososphaerota archaeon]
MSDSLFATVDTLVLSIAILICALASYRAFSSRRALASLVYRRRALWTGTVALISIFFEALQITADYTSYSTVTGVYPQGAALWVFAFLGALTIVGSFVIFAWIDSTIGVALELDFLHRDSLRWKKLRPFAWALVAVGAIGAGISIFQWEFQVFVLMLGAPVAYSVGVLAISGLRVRDTTMRRYFRWMGLIVVALLLQLTTASLNFSINFPLALFAYFLYMASTSLLKISPLNIDVKTPPTSLGEGKAYLSDNHGGA